MSRKRTNADDRVVVDEFAIGAKKGARPGRDGRRESANSREAFNTATCVWWAGVCGGCSVKDR